MLQNHLTIRFFQSLLMLIETRAKLWRSQSIIGGMSKIGVEILDWRRSTDWSPDSVGEEVGERSIDNSLEVFSMAKECLTDRSLEVFSMVWCYTVSVSLRRWRGNAALARRSSMRVP